MVGWIQRHIVSSMKMYVVSLLSGLLWMFAGCNKTGFLDTIPDNSQQVPKTIADFQAILDNDYVMNGYGQSGSPNLGETGGDDYWVPESIFTGSFSPYYQDACTWMAAIPTGSSEVIDWDLPYHRVFYANEALEGLEAIGAPPAAQRPAFNTALGGAYFFRALSFFELAQVFSPAYDSLTAATAWGIPLRLTDLTTEVIRRATVLETYQRITGDLRLAAGVLPDAAPPFPTRPSKTAAYGLLARVYLAMGKYDSACLYSDSCLIGQSPLMQYDTVSGGGGYAFNRFNPEVIFAEVMEQINPSPVSGYLVFVDSTLYRSYSDSDERKSLYFVDYGTGGKYFVGFYDQQGFAFSGLATDEQYLIRAECEARAGKVSAAMQDLNTLLQARWMSGTFTFLTAADSIDALAQILTERRKELLFRGLRWTDLRRLNKDPRWQKTLYREIGSTLYSLPPGDPRYVYPIPDYVIDFNPGMPQNQR